MSSEIEGREQKGTQKEKEAKQNTNSRNKHTKAIPSTWIDASVMVKANKTRHKHPVWIITQTYTQKVSQQPNRQWLNESSTMRACNEKKTHEIRKKKKKKPIRTNTWTLLPIEKRSRAPFHANNQQQIGSHTHLQLHYTRIAISINNSIAIEYKTGNTRFVIIVQCTPCSIVYNMLYMCIIRIYIYL